jgi:hypothetical protein
VDATARVDTPPRPGRKSSATAPRRLGAAWAGLALDHRRALLIVAVVATAILGGVTAALLWGVLHDSRTPATTEQAPARPPLRVGQGGGRYTTVAAALRLATPGDTILVQQPTVEEELLFDGSKERYKNLTIKADNGDEPVVWKTPPQRAPSELITLSGAVGLKLRGFTFDGAHRCTRSVVRLTGRCPGLTLEDVTVQGFAGTGVSLVNCEGEPTRPVTLTGVKVIVAPGATAAAAFGFDLDPPDRKSNRHIHFDKCLPEGKFTTPVLNHPGKVGEDVTGLPQ